MIKKTKTLFKIKRDYGNFGGVSTEWRPWVIVASVFLIGLAVIVIVVGGIRQIAHSMDSASCHGWGENTGHEVQIVDYHYFNWDCLVRLPDGRWVTQEHVVALEGEGGRLKVEVEQGGG